MNAYVVDALVSIHFYQELSILRLLQQCGLVGILCILRPSCGKPTTNSRVLPVLYTANTANSLLDFNQ
jgi:hypothetical protein